MTYTIISLFFLKALDIILYILTEAFVVGQKRIELNIDKESMKWQAGCYENVTCLIGFMVILQGTVLKLHMASL